MYNPKKQIDYDSFLKILQEVGDIFMLLSIEGVLII